MVLDGQSAAGNAADAEHGRVQFEDDLDRHVDDVLRKRARIKRMLLGVWSFLKTRESIRVSRHLYRIDVIIALGVRARTLSFLITADLTSCRSSLGYMGSVWVSHQPIRSTYVLVTYRTTVFWGAAIVFFLGLELPFP